MGDIFERIGNSLDSFGNTLKNAGDNIAKTWNEEVAKAKGINVGTGINTDLTDQLVPRPKVLAEKVLKSKTISCSITLPDPVWDGTNLTPNTITIPFYMSEDFGFGLSNEWSQLVNQDAAFETFKFGLDAMGAFSGQSQVSLQSQAMSSATWKGSKFDGFNLGNCLFVCTNRNIDPSALIYKLCKACLPTKHSDFKGNASSGLAVGKEVAKGAADLAGGLVNLLTLDSFKQAVSEGVTKSKDLIEDVGMIAPFGYGLNIDKTENGGTVVSPIKGTTVTLNIGDWFCATDLVVNSISAIKFSKELIAPPRADVKKGANDLYDPEPTGTNYGFPLYASCSISLKPYCMIDVKTFSKYFKTPNKTNILTANNLFRL